LLFVASKVLWAAFRPDNLLLALIIAGVVLSWTRRRRRAGRWLAALGLAGMVGIAVAPVDALLFAPLEDRFPAMRDPPARVDGIIVLGGAVDALQSQRKGMPSLNDEAERITTMVELARRYPDAKLVFTSGSPSIFGGPSEADATEPLLAGLGLDTSKLIFERKSRNTY